NKYDQRYRNSSWGFLPVLDTEEFCKKFFHALSVTLCKSWAAWSAWSKTTVTLCPVTLRTSTAGPPPHKYPTEFPGILRKPTPPNALGRTSGTCETSCTSCRATACLDRGHNPASKCCSPMRR